MSDKLYVTNFGIDGQTVYVKDEEAAQAIDNFTPVIEQLEGEIAAANADITAVNNKITEIQTELANANVAYVKDFGATGDGTTDDADAIQRAVNSGNSVIMFNPGRYKIGHAIAIPSNKYLIGYGAEIIYSAGDSQACFINASDGSTGGYVANTQINIEGFTFDCASAKATIVAFGHVNNCVIRQCKFSNLRAWHFVELNACKNVKVEQCYFYNYADPTGGEASEMVQIDGAYASIVFPWFGPYDATPCIDCQIIDCVFENPSLPGITEDAANVHAIGNHTDNDNKHSNITIERNYFKNIGVCMRFSNLINSRVINNYMENGYGFYWNASNVENNELYIVGNKLNGTKADYSGHNPYYYQCSAIWLSNSSRTQVLNNLIKGFKDSGIVGGSNSVVISGNSVRDCGFRGIDFSSNVSGICSNNHCVGSGSGSSSEYPYDLVFLNNATGAYNMITGNRCSKIYFLGSTNWDIFTNNSATILETAGASSVIHGNIQNGTWIA